MALMTGCVDIMDSSPERMQSSHLRVPESCNGRLVSICHDIMQLQSKGNYPTPKSIALGLTVRHLTGSKYLTQLLHGMDHTVSYETTLRLETALAEQQRQSQSSLPSGFRKHQPIYIAIASLYVMTKLCDVCNN